MGSDNIFTINRRDDLTEQRIISSCRLNPENIKTISAADVFKENLYLIEERQRTVIQHS